MLRKLFLAGALTLAAYIPAALAGSNLPPPQYYAPGVYPMAHHHGHYMGHHACKSGGKKMGHCMH